MKRFTALVLTLIMVLSLSPINVWAEESAHAGIATASHYVCAEDFDFTDEELFAAYAQREFDAALGFETPSFYRTSVLTDNTMEKKLYDALKTKLADIAAGTVTSTEITVPADATFTKAELGVTGEFLSGEYLTNETAEAIGSKLNLVYTCLLTDCPYELYWHDKTSSVVNGEPVGGVKTSFGCSISGDNLTVTTVTYYFYVAKDYSYSGTIGTFTTDSAKTGATTTAVTNAKAIVAANASKSDLEKLKAYKDEICALVSYDQDAVTNTNTPYGDPWQLISVFDEVTTTNVVCEGYAKAFQYLCDLSAFNGDIECHTVTGTMTGGTGAGAHMWNVVTMDDEKNYLVDVTNCDSGTIGAPDKLFMAYTVNSANANQTHTFTIGSDNVVFTYDAGMSGLFCNGYLALATAAYEESEYLPLYWSDDGGTTYNNTITEPIAQATKNNGYAVYLYTKRGDIYTAIDQATFGNDTITKLSNNIGFFGWVEGNGKLFWNTNGATEGIDSGVVFTVGGIQYLVNLRIKSSAEAATAFVAQYAEDENGTTIDISVPANVSWSNVCRIEAGLWRWQQMSDEEKTAVNVLLGDVTFDDMLKVAVQRIYPSADAFISTFLSANGEPFATISADKLFTFRNSSNYYKYLSAAVKPEINDTVNTNFVSIKEENTTLTYEDVATSAEFILNYLSVGNDTRTLILKLDSNSSADAIRMVTRGKTAWGELSLVQKTAVNKSLKNADANAQTYEQMLDSVPVFEFIKNQLCDPNSGTLYTTATFDNAERLAVGRAKFDALTTGQQTAVRNSVSNVDNLLAAGEFIRYALAGYKYGGKDLIEITYDLTDRDIAEFTSVCDLYWSKLTSDQKTMVNAALADEQTAAGKAVKTVDELYAAAKTMQLEKDGKTAESYIEKFLSFPDNSMILEIGEPGSLDAQYVVNRLIYTWEYWRDDGIVAPKLTVAEQEKVNAALAEAQAAAGKPVKTVQQLRAEAYEKYPVETFIANTLMEWLDGDTSKKLDPVASVNSNNFVRLFAGIDEWNRMPQFFKNEVNQRRTNTNLPTYETLYAQLTEAQKAEALIVMHLGGWNKDTPTVVTSNEKYVAIGARYEWNYLSADGKALVNTHILERVNEDLDAGVITQDQVKYTTYPQMLEISLARDFVDTYLSTGNGGIITEATADNMMRILYGVSPWYWGIVTGNGEAKTAHDWVNEELTAANGGETLTYPMLLEQALKLLYKNVAMRAPTMSDAMYDMFYKSIFSNDANIELAGLVNEMLVHGKYIDMTPFAVEVPKSDVAADAAKVDAYVSNLTEGQVLSYFDLSVYVNADGSELGAISELDEEVTFTLNIPEDQYDSSKEYVLVRVHNGVAEELETEKNNDGTLSVKTNKFSTYAVVEKSKPTGVTVSGMVTSHLSDTTNIDVALFVEGSSEATYITTVKGKNATYSIEGVAAGTYTLNVSKANHVTREYTVVVTDTDVTQDAKIHPKGDISGDGKVTINDVNKANLHYKKKATLSDYESLCADVSGDGNVTINDVNKLNLHYKNKSLLW